MNHDWKPIDPDDDPAEMCTECLQCKCCETPTETCPGAWVDELGNLQGEVEYADSVSVLSIAAQIAEDNAELLKRLS